MKCGLSLMFVACDFARKAVVVIRLGIEVKSSFRFLVPFPWLWSRIYLLAILRLFTELPRCFLDFFFETLTSLIALKFFSFSLFIIGC